MSVPPLPCSHNINCTLLGRHSVCDASKRLCRCATAFTWTGSVCAAPACKHLDGCTVCLPGKCLECKRDRFLTVNGHCVDRCPQNLFTIRLHSFGGIDRRCIIAGSSNGPLRVAEFSVLIVTAVLAFLAFMATVAVLVRWRRRSRYHYNPGGDVRRDQNDVLDSMRPLAPILAGMAKRERRREKKIILFRVANALNAPGDRIGFTVATEEVKVAIQWLSRYMTYIALQHAAHMNVEPSTTTRNERRAPVATPESDGSEMSTQENSPPVERGAGVFHVELQIPSRPPPLIEREEPTTVL